VARGSHYSYQHDRQHGDDPQFDPHRARVDHAGESSRDHYEHDLNEQHHQRDQARGTLVRLDAEERHECLRRKRIVDRNDGDRQITGSQPAQAQTDLRAGQP
jgi:hypothetical protein